MVWYSETIQMLSAQRPQSSAPLMEDNQDTPPLKQEDYPNIKYWKKADHLKEVHR
jgi:hypothetical protein